MNKLLRTDRFRTYTITQLCREFGCTSRALRFYEEQGLLFPRRAQMQRIYSYKDRARLKLIVSGRAVGLSIAEIRCILEAYDDRGQAAQDALALRIFRQRLATLASERQQIDNAMGTLQSAIDRLASQPALTDAA